MEQWKQIENYPAYEVSTEGRVRSMKSGKPVILNQGSSRGYKRVVLYNENGRKDFKVHRLVALAWIDNPENKEQVNHINENSSDNRAENLEWVTVAENINHGSHNKRAAETLTGMKKRLGAVKRIADGEVVAVYRNKADAARALLEEGIRTNLNSTAKTIGECVNGKLRTAYGYEWEYINV